MEECYGLAVTKDAMNSRSNSRAQELVADRVRRIEGLLGRQMPPHPPMDQTPGDQHRHLLEEAQELYENEMAWEDESGEEFTESGAVVELVFPGTLALIDALVTSHERNEKGEGARHRDVVASFLDWMEFNVLDLRSGQSGGTTTGRAKHVDITDRLIDLVLHRYCGLSTQEIERLEAARN